MPASVSIALDRPEPAGTLRSTANRIASIDIMRGIVMIIMALDHARDFYHIDAGLHDPMDLQNTTPFLYFTRFITHFCAPTFVLLAGTAVRISQQRKSMKEISWFLFTRGLWLIVLEVTVIRFSFFFNLYYDVIIFQVIWAIGFSMVLLAAIVRLPLKVIFALGAIITFGHDLLHGIALLPESPYFLLWSFTHQSGVVELAPGHSAFVLYPFLPWFGILLMGYCMGDWFRAGFDAARRRKLLLCTGLAAVGVFLVLRGFNVYGDPVPWSSQKDSLHTLFSFLNVTKYPVSLQYTLITLGPVLVLLSLLERMNTPILKPFAIVGRVPLFYYVIHFYLLHLGALVLLMLRTGKGLSDIDFHFSAGFGGLPPGEGYSLAVVYLAWLAVILILYPLCAWYYRYKNTRKHWWLSYL